MNLQKRAILRLSTGLSQRRWYRGVTNDILKGLERAPHHVGILPVVSTRIANPKAVLANKINTKNNELIIFILSVVWLYIL